MKAAIAFLLVVAVVTSAEKPDESIPEFVEFLNDAEGSWGTDTEEVQASVSATSRAAKLSGVHKMIDNIEELIAYSKAVVDKAKRLKGSHSSATHSVIFNALINYASVKPKDMVVQYAKQTGNLKKFFDKGLAEYILSHMNKAILAGDGVVIVKQVGLSGATKAVLDYKTLGLRAEPAFFKKLTADLSTYEAATTAVAEESGNADNMAAMECLQKGQMHAYKTFLERVQEKYKQQQEDEVAKIVEAADKSEVKAFSKTPSVPVEAPAGMKGAEDEVHQLSQVALKASTTSEPSYKQMQKEAKDMAAEWARGHASACSDTVDVVKKIEQGQKASPNCDAMAGEYELGATITIKKGAIKGVYKDAKLMNEPLQGTVDDETKTACTGSATGHRISVQGGAATATFKFDKKTGIITWSSGQKWTKGSSKKPAKKPSKPTLSCVMKKSVGNKLGASTVKSPGGAYTIMGGGYQQKNHGYNKAAGVEQFSFSKDTYACDAGFGDGNADCFGVFCTLKDKKGAAKLKCQEKKCRVNKESKSCTATLDKGYVMTGGGLINHYRTWDKNSQFEQSRPNGNGWLSDMGFGWGDFTSTVRGCKGIKCVTEVSKQGDATVAKCPKGYMVTGCGIQNDNHDFNKLSLFEYMVPDVKGNKCDCNMGAGIGKDKCYARCCKAA
jgi:hypothetical protein